MDITISYPLPKLVFLLDKPYPPPVIFFKGTAFFDKKDAFWEDLQAANRPFGSSEWQSCNFTVFV